MNIREWTIKRWMMVFISALLLLFIGARLHLKWKVHRVVKALAESGVMTQFEDFYHVLPPVPDDENLVVLLTNAAALLRPPENYRNSTLPYVGGGSSGLMAGEPWPVKMRMQAGQYLAERKVGFAMVTRALERNQARYFSNYNPYPIWDIQPLSTAKKVANNLRLAADYALEQRDYDHAFTRVIELYKLSVSLMVEPLPVNQLVANALTFIVQPPLERLLSSESLSAAQLGQLRRVIQSNLQMNNCSRALEGGRVFIINGVRENLGPLYAFRDVPGFVPEDFRGIWNSGREKISRAIGVIDLDLLLYLDTMNVIIEKAENIDGQVELQNNWNDYVTAIRKSPPRYLTELELETLPQLLKKYVQNHSRLTCADLALAIEQYRLANGGKLPETLDRLAPDFVNSVSNEPYSGKPYELIMTAEGYGIGRGLPEFGIRFLGE